MLFTGALFLLRSLLEKYVSANSIYTIHQKLKLLFWQDQTPDTHLFSTAQ